MKSAAAKPAAAPEGFTFFRSQTALVCLLLTGVTLLLFGQVLRHDYVSYDDGDYVYENKMVQQGLTAESVKWAFTQGHAANWHPLTWLSHMLDWQLYGNQPGKHHFTSVLLHLANSLLVFLVLRKMTSQSSVSGMLPTRSVWPSAFVAALFAWHPLHVESVAWLSERKDVLCAFFGLLTLGSYTVYAKLDATTPHYRRQKATAYFATWLLFACGLMSKPMLVTLPFVLLLLDFWPLQRMVKPVSTSGETQNSKLKTQNWFSLLLEKLPFLALAIISSYVTFQVQLGKTVQSLSNFSLLDRLSNVSVTYVTYLWKMIWPSDLAFFYPLVKAPPLGQSGLAVLFLAAITVWLLFCRQRWPWAITGWFWYLGTLVPVIGLVHVGEQSHADRYTYLPSIGIFFALAWTAAKWTEQKRIPKSALYFSAVAVLAAFSVVTWNQVGHWKNSRDMLQRAIAVTEKNFLAHNNYGVVLADEGKYDEAIEHYEEALRWKPTYARCYDNWASALTMKDRFDEAVEKYQIAIQLNPNEARTRHNLAVTLARQKNYDEAIAQCREALRLNPKYFEAYFDLALALHLTGQFDEAIPAFEKYLQSSPNDGPAHLHLASAWAKKKNFAAAAAHYRESIRLQPDVATAYANLAWILAANDNAELRNGAEAVQLAERAAQMTNYKHLFTQGVLAAAYAEAGRFAEALETVQKAIALAEQSGRTEFVRNLQQQQQFYQAGKPFREKM